MNSTGLHTSLTSDDAESEVSMNASVVEHARALPVRAVRRSAGAICFGRSVCLPECLGWWSYRPADQAGSDRRERRAVITAHDASAQEWEPSEDEIRQAYIYLLGRMLVIRQEHIDRGSRDFAYNRIVYNSLGSADFVNANFDVAYLEAWFAVSSDCAVTLEVPEITGRYYTVQILDEWGEVIVNINDRSTPARPHGRFALLAPGATTAIPPEATPVVLHSGKAKMLARIELGTDPDGAVALQRRFTATALGEIAVPPPPSIPQFGNAELLGAEIFENLDPILATAPDTSPAAARMQILARSIAAHLAGDPAARARTEQFLRDTVVPEFQRYALTASAPSVNHWVGGAATGNYGPDYTLRTVVNMAGIWANTAEEVIYFITSRDNDDRPLDGARSYLMHFPTDHLPATVVDSYWSVILVSIPDFRVVPNSERRYNFNSYSPLTYNPDGSLTLTFGPRPLPTTAETNRLPTDPGRPFSLTFRCYVPKPSVGQGYWAPPPVTPLS